MAAAMQVLCLGEASDGFVVFSQDRGAAHTSHQRHAELTVEPCGPDGLEVSPQPGHERGESGR